MQAQQPRKCRQADRGGDQQPRRTTLLQPQIWQIAADDFGQRRDDEQGQRFRDDHVESRLQQAFERTAAAGASWFDSSFRTTQSALLPLEQAASQVATNAAIERSSSSSSARFFLI